jgi:hypothetical protein
MRILAMTAVAFALAFPAGAEEAWHRQVAEALGKSGAEMPGGVYRVGMPRTDIKAKLDGVELKPGFALGSWVAFEKHGDAAVVMGDLVLLGDEVNPVMKKLEEGGIEISALHNHLLRNEPFTMYMHVHGHGDPAALAKTLHAALAESKTPLAEASGSSQAQASGQAQPPIELDTAKIDEALGRKGRVNGGIYAVSVPRATTPKDEGMEVPEAMGSATAINFQPTGGGKAAITGDFVMIATEVNPVVKALRENGIEVTALHNHMLNDEPRLFFMHFWANDDAAKLAKGLRAALDKMDVKKG